MIKQAASRDVLLQTPLIEEAADFYTGQFGLTEFMRTPNMIGLEAGGLRLFLDRAPAYGPVLEFFVDDLAAAKAALIASGCRIENEDPSVPRCYVRDRYGLIFNVSARMS